MESQRASTAVDEDSTSNGFEPGTRDHRVEILDVLVSTLIDMVTKDTETTTRNQQDDDSGGKLPEKT